MPTTPKMTPRKAVAAYIAAGKHLLPDKGYRELAEIADELGIHESTARRWAREDHREEYLELWASVDEYWTAKLEEEQRRPIHEQEAEQRRSAELIRPLPEPDPAKIAAEDEIIGYDDHPPRWRRRR